MHTKNTSPLPDDEIMNKFCAPIETKLRTAGSREEAQQLLNAACANFEQECNSEIIALFLRRFATETFKKYWDAK